MTPAMFPWTETPLICLAEHYLNPTSLNKHTQGTGLCTALNVSKDLLWRGENVKQKQEKTEAYWSMDFILATKWPCHGSPNNKGTTGVKDEQIDGILLKYLHTQSPDTSLDVTFFHYHTTIVPCDHIEWYITIKQQNNRFFSLSEKNMRDKRKREIVVSSLTMTSSSGVEISW